MGRRQHLQPGAILPVGPDKLWLFDVFHPVAAVIDRANGGVRGLVSWAEVPPPAEGWRIAVHGREVWVQPAPTGPLIRLDATGIRSAHSVGQARLAGAGPAGAWCMSRVPDQDLADHPGVPPRSGTAMREDRLLLVTADDEHHTVTVPGQVRRVAHSPGGGIDVEVDALPWHRRPLHHKPRIIDGVELGLWEAVWESVWLHLPADFTGDRVDPATHGTCTPSGGVTPGTVPAVGEISPSWYREELAVRRGRRAGGLAWIAGWRRQDIGLPDHRRSSLITGHDPVTGERRHDIDLGVGRVGSMTVDGDDLLLLVFRIGAHPGAGHTEVLRLDGRTGTVVLVCTVPPIDLDGRGWPLVRRPVEAASHERSFLRSWGHVEHYWRSPDGSTRPLAEGISDTRLEVTESWPDAQVRLSFAFARRPGRRLVHVRDLYDDLGRPVPNGYDLIYLMENLDTGLRS